MRRRAGVMLVAAAVFAAGCGGGTHKTGLTAGQRSGLLAQLEAARASAAAGNLAGTETAVRRFRVSIARLQGSGALTAAEARTLRLGAAHLLARVKSDAAPPPAPVQTQPTPAPTPTPVPPGHAKKPKHGKEHGKGHGKGKGEGGD